jgi:hypothetical protein
MAQLCNLLFPVRCWSQNCDLVLNIEAWVKTHPHIVVLTFKPYTSQHKTPLCILDIEIVSWFGFRITHTTVYLFAVLRPVISILHSKPAVGRDWSSQWGGLRSKHPSTPCILCIRGAQGWDLTLSVHSLSVSSSHCHFQVPSFSPRHFSKYLTLRIQLIGTCVANNTCLQELKA